MINLLKGSSLHRKINMLAHLNVPGFAAIYGNETFNITFAQAMLKVFLFIGDIVIIGLQYIRKGRILWIQQ